MRVVYVDQVHENNGSYLSSGITDNQQCQEWWCNIAVLPQRCYDTDGGNVGRRFLQVILKYFTGVQYHCLNTQQFIIFQTVILKRARNVKGVPAIRQRIQRRLDTWDSFQHQIMVKKMHCLCKQYLAAAQRQDSNDQQALTYTGLVLWENLWDAVLWMTYFERGGVPTQ